MKYEKRCKSFTMRDGNGSFLTVSETEDREAIAISLESLELRPGFARILLDADQFELLCRTGSSYDGLTVRSTAEEIVPVE